MGCNPTGPTNPAGVGIRDPENLEAIQTGGGLWWLATHADPARIVTGSFGSEDAANAHRQWLIDQRQRMAPAAPAMPVDINAHIAEVVKRNRQAADDLALLVAFVCHQMCDAIATPDHRIRFDSLVDYKRRLIVAVEAYRKAVDHG